MKYWLVLGFYGGPEVQNTTTEQQTQQIRKHMNKFENTTTFDTFRLCLYGVAKWEELFWASRVLEIQVLFIFSIDNVTQL